MRRVKVKDLVPGMRVGMAVLGPNNEIYLKAGVKITAGYITRLLELGFSWIYIDEGPVDYSSVPDVIMPATRTRAIEQVRQVMLEALASQTKLVTIPPALNETVNEMIEQLTDNPSAMVNLADIRTEDEYLYHHSVNVCVLALITGIRLGLDRTRLYTLGVGALMHDIGKIQIPDDVLYKPGKLTREEFEIIKKHPVYGRDLLAFDPDVAAIAYAHHERFDGGGYPLGLKGADLGLEAQIVGIADIFDALTADRIYRPAQPVHEAYEMLAAAGNYWFHFDLLQAFLANVAAYPTGTIVELNTGEVGVVIDTPPGYPTFPNLKVLTGPEMRGLKQPYALATLTTNRWVARVLTQEQFPGLRFVQQDSAL
ncbi:MAG: HD-GYP domain-containing protein [Thermoanaerobacterales bacterium]|nr:HD-GYP domain-containing protein [Thermoanaerobacterales bacterium]